MSPLGPVALGCGGLSFTVCGLSWVPSTVPQTQLSESHMHACCVREHPWG